MTKLKYYHCAMIKMQCITIDCADPAALADFWSKVLDWKIGGEGDEVWIEKDLKEGETTDAPDILFLRNPDKKKVKNRLHLDLRPDNQAAEVDRLIALGAKKIEIGQSNYAECTWVVMADPDGNEFCVLRERND
jgi:predicted enzyme related to lactoylglutathione lyase